MRFAALAAVALLFAIPCNGIAQEPPPLVTLSAYRPLLDEVLRSSPELHRLQAMLEADRARVPQAGALADPELGFGFQRRAAMDVIVPNPVMPEMPLMGVLPIGTEFSLMATQAFPWPGKRKGRTDLAQAGLDRSEAELQRLRMDLEVQVQEGLNALLRLKSELGLLGDQDRLWAEAEALAKQCCELGTGTQSDLLLVLMARARLAQRRLELETQEDLQRTALNRQAGRPLDAPVPLPEMLEQVARPKPPVAAEALEDARRRSPELQLGLRELHTAQRTVALGRMDLRPDIRVTAGAMREPGMGFGWKAEVGVSLPIWSGSKQRQALLQRQAEQGAAKASQAGLALILEQSLTERLRLWSLAERQLKLYEEALLPQGELALRSLMGQYESGKATFQSVLDALNSRLKDRQGRLDILSRIQSLAIAQQRVSLGAGAWSPTGAPEAAMGSATRPAPPRSIGSAAPAAAQAVPKSSSMSM
jgi:outer membrane protein TolC